MDFHRSGLIAFANAGRAGGSNLLLLNWNGAVAQGWGHGGSHSAQSVCLARGTRSQSLSSRQMRRARVDGT